MDREQRPRQRANGFAAGVLPSIPSSTLLILFITCCTQPNLYIQVWISKCVCHTWIILECWSVTSLPPLCSHGKVQAISRKPHLSPIPEGCAIISCKTGNKQSHLPCSVEWKRSVRLPTLSCASSLYFVRKIHATFQKPWLSQAGKR